MLLRAGFYKLLKNSNVVRLFRELSVLSQFNVRIEIHYTNVKPFKVLYNVYCINIQIIKSKMITLVNSMRLNGRGT